MVPPPGDATARWPQDGNTMPSERHRRRRHHQHRRRALMPTTQAARNHHLQRADRQLLQTGWNCTWAVTKMGAGKYCSGSYTLIRKKIAAKLSVENCADMVANDLECGFVFYAKKAGRCGCVRSGRTCVLTASKSGSSVYQLECPETQPYLESTHSLTLKPFALTFMHVSTHAAARVPTRPASLKGLFTKFGPSGMGRHLLAPGPLTSTAMNKTACKDNANWRDSKKGVDCSEWSGYECDRPFPGGGHSSTQPLAHKSKPSHSPLAMSHIPMSHMPMSRL